MIRVPETWAALADLKLMNGDEPTGSDWKTWVVGEGGFSWSGDDLFDEVFVPKGFMTDFASIPRMFRWLFGPSDGPHRLAGIAHDFLYSSVKDVNRRESDRIFLRIAKEAGSSVFSRWSMYLALRVGGWMAWRNNRKNLKTKGPNWRFLA